MNIELTIPFELFLPIIIGELVAGHPCFSAMRTRPAIAHLKSRIATRSLVLLASMLLVSMPGMADDRLTVTPPDLSKPADVTRSPGAGSSNLQALLGYYREAIASMQYQEAETAAKRRIEHLLGSEGSSGYAMADALIDLAFAQRQREQYEAAIQNYTGAIGVLEAADDMLSSRLITPLRGIGETYVASGNAELALPLYERALHVNHVNSGPHNLEQLELLDAMIEAEIQAGRADAALGIVDRIGALYARRYATDSEAMLPVLWRRAGLLNGMDRHQDERLAYLDIVRIVEMHHGEYDGSLIKTYTALGRTYLHEVDQAIFRSEPTAQTGETYLKRAVDVARKSEADVTTQSRTLIDLADYYTILNVQDRARQNYRAAWSLLSKDARHLAERIETFNTMVPLVQPKLDKHANFGYRSSDGDLDPTAQTEGFMLAQFTINERGRVTDIEIIEADPPEFPEMKMRLERTLRDSVYRPRYEDGNPIKVREQQMRHSFVYTDQASAAWQKTKP